GADSETAVRTTESVAAAGGTPRATPTIGENTSKTVNIPASAANVRVLSGTPETIPFTLRFVPAYRPRRPDNPHPSALREGRAYQTRPHREARSVPRTVLWHSRMGLPSV